MTSESTMTNTVSLPAGHALHVRADDGPGVPVVFLNSLAADLTMWDDLLAELPPRRTLRYDARGHGRSDVVPGDCSVADLAADALALLDAQGIGRAVLCGISLGGITAMQIAALAPERVAGLVLANTAVNFPPPQMWWDRAAAAREQGLAPLVEATMQRWLSDGYRAAQPVRAAAVEQMIAATSPEGYAACCAALATADLTAELTGYRGPGLIVCGRHDQSTPPARAVEMQGLCMQAEVRELDSAHLSPVEATAGFVTALAAFLAGVDGAEAGR